MATNDTNLSRRETLAGIALCGATAATPIAGATIAKATQQPDRKAWDRAFAALQSAHKASNDLDGPIDAVSEAFEAECAAIPHATFTSEDTHAFRRTLSTASQADVADARRFLRGVVRIDEESGLRPYAEVCRKIIAADDARKAEIERIDQRLGYSKAHAHYDALSSAICDAETVLLDMPAPDADALLWKVERLYRPGEGIWSEGVEDQTHADLRRFLSTGRA